jgi:hypothetical protein
VSQDFQLATNRHPVDELADLREQKRQLEAREEELRKLILGGECGLIGYDHEARISEFAAERIDTKAAKAALGDVLTPFLKQSVTKTVRITRREEPDAA